MGHDRAPRQRKDNFDIGECALFLTLQGLYDAGGTF